MSILHFINGKNRSLSQLKGSIAYIFNPEKVKHGCRGGTGVVYDEAYDDMKIIKVLHNKTKGRQYIHFIISFDKGISYLKAFDICEEILDYFSDEYQIVFAVHENTENIHGHFILNTVAVDGRKFRQSTKEMLSFRTFVNEILEDYGLNTIGKIEMMPIDDYAELSQFLNEIIIDEDMWSDLLYESCEDEAYLEDKYESESNGAAELFGTPYFPIWFGENKPYVPIWFDETHEEKPLIYEPIKFDETHEEKPLAFPPIMFFDEEE